MAHGRGEDAPMVKERCAEVCDVYAGFVVAALYTWMLCCRSMFCITGAGRGLALAEALHHTGPAHGTRLKSGAGQCLERKWRSCIT